MASASITLLSGLQPWLRPYAEYAVQVMQLNSGGVVDARGRIQGGITPTITSGYRSIEKQKELYANRASNPYPPRGFCSQLRIGIRL